MRSRWRKGLTMSTYTTPTALYEHPDGEGRICFDAQAMHLCITNEAHEPPTTSHAVMGPWGMRKLAMALLALAAELDDEPDELDDEPDNAPAIIYTPAQLAEHHGAQIAHDALEAMLAAPDQGKRMTILRKAIIAVSKTKHPKEAAGGFAVCMVNVIERGLEAISHDRP